MFYRPVMRIFFSVGQYLPFLIRRQPSPVVDKTLVIHTHEKEKKIFYDVKSGKI